MDFEIIASEFLRALRGRRSQTAFSRRLGYRSNIAYRWETGRCWPTAACAMRSAGKVGVDIEEALLRFYGTEPSWLSQHKPDSPQGITAFLNDIRGTLSVTEWAHRSGLSRFMISRWLKGISEPRLPDFFNLIQTVSLRLLDYLAAFVDPAQMPLIAKSWAELLAAREAAYETPWSHVVLRAIELRDYQKLSRHRRGWIAERLGLAPEEEERCIDVLKRAGRIRFRNGLWRSGEPMSIDTRDDPERSRRLRAWWMQVAQEKLEKGDEGMFGFNLFTVSKADFVRLQELHNAYFQKMRMIIAQSEPCECVVLYNQQLFRIDKGNGGSDVPPVINMVT